MSNIKNLLLILLLTTSTGFAQNNQQTQFGDSQLKELEESASELQGLLENIASVGSELGKQAYGIDLKNSVNAKSRNQITADKKDDLLKNTLSESKNIAGNAFEVLSLLAKKDLERINNSGSQNNLTSNKQAVDLNGKGALLAVLGNLEQAVDSFKQAIIADPNYASAYYNLSCALAKQNKKSESLNALNKAIVLDKKYSAMAKADADFKNFKSDQEFLNIIESK